MGASFRQKMDTLIDQYETEQGVLRNAEAKLELAKTDNAMLEERLALAEEVKDKAIAQLKAARAESLHLSTLLSHLTRCQKMVGEFIANHSADKTWDKIKRNFGLSYMNKLVYVDNINENPGDFEMCNNCDLPFPCDEDTCPECGKTRLTQAQRDAVVPTHGS